MATTEQVAEMLAMMKTQMEKINVLQKENEELKHRPSEVKPKRPDRPVIEGDLSDSEWSLFLDTWGRYKRMTGLVNTIDIRMELRAACSTEVNKLLFEFVGAKTLDGASEEELLAYIKGIAVKGLHKEVHRVNFGKLKQSEGESITHYVARLKAQAALCEFSVNCSCAQKVSFSEEMVSQQLLTTLQDKVVRLQSLEATAESTTKLHAPSRPMPSQSNAAKSSYKKGGDPKKNIKDNKKEVKVCQFCGRSNHYGRSMDPVDCPAYKKKCNKCEEVGHFGKVCKSKACAVTEEVSEEEEETTEASSAYFFATHEDNVDFRASPMKTRVGGHKI